MKNKMIITLVFSQDYLQVLLFEERNKLSKKMIYKEMIIYLKNYQKKFHRQKNNLIKKLKQNIIKNLKKKYCMKTKMMIKKKKNSKNKRIKNKLKMRTNKNLK